MKVVGTRNEANRVAWLERTLGGIPAGQRILDAGAGELAFKRFCGHLDYIAQDFAQYDGVGDAKGLQTGSWDRSGLDIVSDITAIPEPDASFDAVMCVEVFEHLPEPALAVKEFGRLLRPGGRLIITAPFCSLTHFAPYHFATGYNRYFYERVLAEHGFHVDELVENGSYFEYLAQEVRRLPVVAEKYCGATAHLWERAVLKLVLLMLSHWSRADAGSSELLHFGCFVSATKQSGAA